MRRSTPRLALWLLLAVLIVPLSGCPGEAPAGPASQRILSSIAIAPTGPTLTAIGDTHQLTATALDEAGQPVEGVEFRWTSSDEGVATMGAGGLVTARGNGEATIRAAAGELAGRTLVTVAQRASSVTVHPPEASFGGPGASIQFEASGRDANGHPIAPALFVWSSSDPDVVTVDDAGRAVAWGEGEAQVRAAVGGTRAEAAVEVGDAEPPVLISLSPDPLVEGGEAVLRWTGVSGGLGGPRVTVDGVEASVLAVSEAEIEIVVPTFDCRPAREVEVRVEAAGFTAAGQAARLRASAPSLALEPGRHLILESPSDFCLQFDEASGAESYLIGVQSTSGLASDLTDLRIASVTAAREKSEKIALSGPPPSLATRDAGPPDRNLRGARGERPEASRSLRAHREAEARLRAWEREHLSGFEPLPSAARSDDPAAHQPAAGEARLPTVGETMSIRLPHIGSGRACAAYSEVEAVVRAVGRRGIWLEDPSNPSGGFQATDFEALSAELDAAIYDTNVTYFGAPTDLDGNERILVLVTRELNRTAPGALGFVFGGDLFARESCAASDEGELFYGRAPDPQGRWGNRFATEDARRLYPRLIAHELAHIIQFGRRLAAGRPYMTTWMMEGQAMVAEEVVGHALTGRGTGADYGFEVAWNHSGADAVEWYRNAFTDMAFYFGYETGSSKVEGAPHECGWLRQDPAPCIGRSLWYGVAWSFLRWASDHFGPGHAGGEAGFHRTLVESDRTGFENVSARTGESAERMLAEWAASLYLDGRAEGLEARLTLPSWDLYGIFRRLVPSARLQPLTRAFSDFEAVGAVRAGSTVYVQLEADGRPAAAVRVRSPNDEPLPADMQVWVVRIR